jgi:hypothetical protein
MLLSLYTDLGDDYDDIDLLKKREASTEELHDLRYRGNLLSPQESYNRLHPAKEKVGFNNAWHT